MALLRNDSVYPAAARIRQLVALSAMFIAACAQAPSAVADDDESGAMEGFTPAQQFEIVDCLYPGQVRTVGGRVYMTPRRTGRTTVADCAASGGEFTLYDRANPQASLAIWLPEAEAGDPEAQTYVGMLYERGIGGPPDYEAAVRWYRAAAEQDYSHGQFSLGTMYERGLGVDKDVNEAFNLYREAQGVSDDDLVFASVMRRALEDQRAILQDTINERQQEINVLAGQIDSLRAQEGVSEATIDTLQRLVNAAEAERDAAVAEVQSLPPVSEEPDTEIPGITPGEIRRLGDAQLGRYYAIIIGVHEYTPFPALSTVRNDMDRAERILSEQYGFSVTRLENPSRFAVLDTINRFHSELGDNDNLLIYFAGRGEVLSAGDQRYGYWLPSDAEAPPSDTFWIANELVTGHLGRINARRILVVSDATFVNLPESSPGMVAYFDDVSPGYLSVKLPLRARMLLASGTAGPVADESGQSSRFARAFLDVLEANDGLLHVPALFRRIRERLAAEPGEGVQEPIFRTVKAARHELGEFFFVPANLR